MYCGMGLRHAGGGCRYGALSDLEDSIKVKLQEVPPDSMLKEEVGPEEVSCIVSKWTGIPVTKLQEEDRDRLLRLPEELHQRVVGQDQAVSVVANAVLRSRCDPTLSLPSTPLFLFL